MQYGHIYAALCIIIKLKSCSGNSIREYTSMREPLKRVNEIVTETNYEAIPRLH